MVPREQRYDNLPQEILQLQGTNGMMPAPWWSLTKKTTKTDAEGRFRIDGLVPVWVHAVRVGWRTQKAEHLGDLSADDQSRAGKLDGRCRTNG